MKKIFVFALSLVILVSVFVSFKISQIPTKPVHYHANFAVFVDGKQEDFTKPQLMHIKPCSNDEAESNDPKENVHLHDQIGNVVHLHADGIHWNFFLSTIHFDLAKKTEGKSLTVYSKGLKVDSKILDETIQKQDQILIHIATQSGAQKISYDPVLVEEETAVGTSAADYDAGKGGAEKCGVIGNRTLWQRFKLAFGL